MLEIFKQTFRERTGKDWNSRKGLFCGNCGKQLQTAIFGFNDRWVPRSIVPLEFVPRFNQKTGKPTKIIITMCPSDLDANYIKRLFEGSICEKSFRIE